MAALSGDRRGVVGAASGGTIVGLSGRGDGVGGVGVQVEGTVIKTNGASSAVACPGGDGSVGGTSSEVWNTNNPSAATVASMTTASRMMVQLWARLNLA